MSEFVDPEQFVISRKRKKYRFAKFANAKNCFEFEEWQPRPVDTLEIGAGTAFFSVELAARYPQRTFVALDVKADRLQRGAYQAIERGIENVYFVRARANQITELFAADSLQQIWLTFPDPFPRKHSSGRRLTNPRFLQTYAQLLGKDGSLLLKHDNPAFFQWSLEQLVEHQWRIARLSFDLHDSGYSDDDDSKILTSYEQRWLEERRVTSFVQAAHD